MISVQGILLRTLAARHPGIATVMGYSTIAADVLKSMIADTEDAAVRRKQLAELPNGEVAQLFAMSVVGQKIVSLGVENWEDVDWDQVVPPAIIPKAAAGVMKPMQKLKGPLGGPADIMRVLNEAAANIGPDTVGAVLETLMSRKPKDSKEDVDPDRANMSQPTKRRFNFR